MITVYNDDYKNHLEEAKGLNPRLILTDPPYSFKSKPIEFSNNRSEHKYDNPIGRSHLTEIENDIGLEFNVEDMLNSMVGVQDKFNGVFWCNELQLPRYLDWVVAKDYVYSILTWCKSNPPPTINNKWLRNLEFLVHIKERGVKFNASNDYNGRHSYYVSPTIRSSSTGHPTSKPVPYLERIIEQLTDKGDLVFDPFMGTGSTGVACINKGRKFLGCEIKKEYCDFWETRKTVALSNLLGD